MDEKKLRKFKRSVINAAVRVQRCTLALQMAEHALAQARAELKETFSREQTIDAFRTKRGWAYPTFGQQQS